MGSWSLDTSWEKKSGVASRGFPGNQWHDAVSSEKTLAPAVTRRKKEKKKSMVGNEITRTA